MAKQQYVSQINDKKIYAERAGYTVKGVDIDDKLEKLEQEITSMGAFEVVPLTSGENPVPDVQDPSTKVIYLTKESGSAKTDPYTEWIYIAGTPSGTWEVIGDTSIDLDGKADKVTNATANNFAGLNASGNLTDSGYKASDFKTKQDAVSDPTASGTALAFIDSISQDADGVITPTKKTVANASASTSGVGGSAGLMTATDKEKLDALPTNAELEAALADKKDVQTAVVDPSASGTSITFIDSISQDAQGVITPTKKTVANASASTSGVGGSAGLMTAADKEKLDGIEAGAEANVQADWAQTTTSADDYIKNKPTALSDFSDDITEQTYIPTGEGSANPISGAGVASAMSSYKPKQDAVVDPTASGNAISFIDSISQNDVGVITPTKKTIPNAVASSSGTGGSAGLMTGADKEKLDGIEAGAEANVQADWSVTNTSSDAYIANKPTALSDFTDDITSQTYVGTGTGSDAPISGAGVKDALDTLDAEVTSSDGTNVQVKVTEVDGKITAVNITTDNTASTTTVAGKADKVTGAIDGNFAGLDSNGNLTDSGSKASDFKTKQSAVSDPTASGTTLEFISSISQDANGVITPAKATVQTASTSVYGVVIYGTVELDALPTT